MRIWIISKLGGLIDFLVGSRTTLEYKGEAAYRSVTLRPSLAEDDVEIGVTITQTIYQTNYQRWWSRKRTHSIYQVVAFAPPDVREKLDPLLFEPVTYPMLCNPLLKHTRYPHLYALHAFLERMSPFYPTIKCEL